MSSWSSTFSFSSSIFSVNISKRVFGFGATFGFSTTVCSPDEWAETIDLVDAEEVRLSESVDRIAELRSFCAIDAVSSEALFFQNESLSWLAMTDVSSDLV